MGLGAHVSARGASESAGEKQSCGRAIEAAGKLLGEDGGRKLVYLKPPVLGALGLPGQKGALVGIRRALAVSSERPQAHLGDQEKERQVERDGNANTSMAGRGTETVKTETVISLSLGHILAGAPADLEGAELYPKRRWRLRKALLLGGSPCRSTRNCLSRLYQPHDPCGPGCIPEW